MAFEWMAWDLDRLKRDEFKFKQQDFQCRICGEHGKRDGYSYSHVMDICQNCADVAANLYSKTHSGTFLTWPEEKETPLYKKQPIPESLRWEVFERDNFTCKSCGSKKLLRADHIHPESKGGEMTLDNLQTLCNRCNCSKGSKIVD